MKVTKINKRVESLSSGSVFEHEGNFYMVTNKRNDCYIVCVDTETGECADFRFDEKVKPRLAEVIIMNDVE